MSNDAGSSGGTLARSWSPRPVPAHQVEAFADAGQHAQRQHIDLHQAQRVDIVLVPFDEGAVVHRRIVDRHRFVQPILGQHEAADMLRQMARKVEDARSTTLRSRTISGLSGSKPLRLSRLLPAISPAPAAPDRA
jgi:hypothetical protein